MTDAEIKEFIRLEVQKQMNVPQVKRTAIEDNEIVLDVIFLRDSGGRGVRVVLKGNTLRLQLTENYGNTWTYFEPGILEQMNIELTDESKQRILNQTRLRSQKEVKEILYEAEDFIFLLKGYNTIETRRLNGEIANIDTDTKARIDVLLNTNRLLNVDAQRLRYGDDGSVVELGMTLLNGLVPFSVRINTGCIAVKGPLRITGSLWLNGKEIR